MRIFLPSLLFFLAGIGLGWFSCYAGPNARNQRELLKQYQSIRDKFQLTDAEMADFGKHLPEYSAAMKRQDEMAALISYWAYKHLEEKKINDAKWELAAAMSIYYRAHAQDGNTNLLHRITAYAATHAALSNAIYGNVDSNTPPAN